MVLTGLNFNTSSTIDVTKLTVTGQGSSTVTLTSATANSTPESSTSATIVITGVDKTAVDAILNNSGIRSFDAITYNLAAASGWQTGTVAFPTIGLTAKNEFILDFVENATIAYSLRQLRAAYTGPLIQVVRSSDNQTQDIYADIWGNLDISSLLSFVGVNNGYVSIWYYIYRAMVIMRLRLQV